MIDDADIKARSAHRAERAVVARFESLEQENARERIRRATSRPEQRLAELRALKDRIHGPGWDKRPIEKTWSIELVDWYPGSP